jgi:hypothetical protein
MDRAELKDAIADALSRLSPLLREVVILKHHQKSIVQSIGSLGVSVVLVLIAGSFITLALAPILLMDSNKKFSS